MAEAAGLAATILTITVGIIKGIKYAKTCYRATEHLEALQEQVDQFANVVREIDNRNAVSLTNVITAALSRAKLMLDDLDQLMQVKLLKSADGSVRIRRRAWARNQSKVNKAKIELKEQRISLIAAVSASSLAAVHRSEVTLVSVGRVVSFSREASSKLGAQLSGLDVLGEDNDVRFNIINEEFIRKLGHERSNDLRPVLDRSSNLCQDVLSFLEDLGCRRVIEDQVTQIQILDPPNKFASCLDGVLVYEVKFTSSIPNPEWVYIIQVLHCLRGVPGFAKLTRAYCKPDQVNKGQLIPWARREKWANQLVQAIRDIHSRGLVVGAFFGSWSPILIEGSDCIQFWRFKKIFEPIRTIRCYYPPEFLYLREASLNTRKAKAPASTSKTDLFHLGLLLWLLAENVSLSRINPVCIKEGCNLKADFCCTASHVEAATLPELPADIPPYYKAIVEGCRAENPKDRPPARQILEWFPTLHEFPSTPSAYSASESNSACSNTDSIGRGLLGMRRCSGCGTTNVQCHYFHCGACDTGDFDICPTCYDKGLHCHDKGHLLMEYMNDGFSIVLGNYHSSPQAT